MNFPILSAIIFIPFIGALFILITRGNEKNIEKNSKYVAIFRCFVAIFMFLLHGLLNIYLRDPLLKLIGIIG